jgi:hypothetical protein
MNLAITRRTMLLMRTNVQLNLILRTNTSKLDYHFCATANRLVCNTKLVPHLHKMCTLKLIRLLESTGHQVHSGVRKHPNPLFPTGLIQLPRSRISLSHSRVLTVMWSNLLKGI